MNIVLNDTIADKVARLQSSALDLARHDKARKLRSWWPKDLKLNFHDADLNFKHQVTVNAYIEEYTR
jgi:hypothetical protein